MFEVLLGEMVGLGILREVPDKKYAIRTRNLRLLLGNDDEIERRFADAKSKRAPAIFDPAQFRTTLSGEIPSSLTAEQENRLLSGRHAVGLVFGTRLAGLDRMRDSLERAARARDGTLSVKEVTPALLKRAVSQDLKSRKPGTHVILVDIRGSWNPMLVSDTLASVAEQDAQNRLVRPVFVCGPHEAWRWLENPMPPKERTHCCEVWLGPCALEFTRTWLTDQESAAHACMDNRDPPVDPPWPSVVGTAATNKRLGTIREAVESALRSDEDNRYVSDVLIPGSAKTALRLMSTFSDDSLTADFLSDLSQDEGASMSPEEALDFFDWAEHLGIVHRDGFGHRLDSTYAAGLSRVFEG